MAYSSDLTDKEWEFLEPLMFQILPKSGMPLAILRLHRSMVRSWLTANLPMGQLIAPTKPSAWDAT
jgi:hypothetical protein